MKTFTQYCREHGLVLEMIPTPPQTQNQMTGQQLKQNKELDQAAASVMNKSGIVPGAVPKNQMPKVAAQLIKDPTLSKFGANASGVVMRVLGTSPQQQQQQ